MEDKLTRTESKFYKEYSRTVKSNRRLFIKKTKLPIPLTYNYDNEFEYYLETLDEDFGAITQYDKFLQEVCVDRYMEKSSKYIQEIARKIKGDVLDSINELDLNKLNPSENMKGMEVGSNLLITQNDGKKYISLDISQADYNTIKRFSNYEEERFEDFVRNHFEGNYDVNKFRKVVFGNINPKRVQKIQKYYMSKLMDKLRGLSNQYILVGNDELVIEYTDEAYKYLKANKTELENEIEYPLNMEVFTLRYLGVEGSYVKEMEYMDNEKGVVVRDNKRVKFLGVPKTYFMQLYKNYFNMELTDKDLYFEHEGQPAKLIYPLGSNVVN